MRTRAQREHGAGRAQGKRVAVCALNADKNILHFRSLSHCAEPGSTPEHEKRSCSTRSTYGTHLKPHHTAAHAFCDPTYKLLPSCARGFVRGKKTRINVPLGKSILQAAYPLKIRPKFGPNPNPCRVVRAGVCTPACVLLDTSPSSLAVDAVGRRGVVEVLHYIQGTAAGARRRLHGSASGSSRRTSSR